MQIKNTVYSHPNKIYNTHIDNIIKSFPEDEEHKICTEYHDLGKLSKQFQIYITLKKNDDENEIDFQKRRNKEKTTHTLEGAYLYFLNEKRRDIYFLANFISGLKHHSNLPDILKEATDYLSIIDNYLSEERLQVIQYIANEVNLKFEGKLYSFIDYFNCLEENKYFFSLTNFFLIKKRYSRLILADKYEAIFSKPYKQLETISQDEIKKYIKNINNEIQNKQKENKNDYRTKIRNTIFKKYEENRNKSFYLIKAPTGAGKTLIALELALKIAQDSNNGISRIITVLPFTSIIDQTHFIYEEILEIDILKYHHLTQYSKDIKKNEQDEKEQFSEKFFSIDIWHNHFIVTTFNQICNIFFSNHNRDNIRLETIRDSIIIIDEIQNIGRGLLKSFILTLDEYSKEYNIKFIIMSATMPFIEEDLKNKSYSLLSEEWFYTTNKNRYILKYTKETSDIDILYKEIEEENQKGKSVLCVVNTIQKAKDLFIKLVTNENHKIYLLTSHQIPLHRKEIIKEINEKLQKKQKIILISTQLIEAGVDLDFDIGFRECSPFSSIIQTAGRVNREGKHKEPAEVVVFDFLDGKDYPYRKLDLQKDWFQDILNNKKHIEEKNILNEIEAYFRKTREETTQIDLLKYMKQLNFETLSKKYNEMFMPQEYASFDLFIEQKENQFYNFITKCRKIKEEKNTFEAKSLIKEESKELGLYTISLNEKIIYSLITNHQSDIKELCGRYILPFDLTKTFYSKSKGFNQEYANFL